MDNITNKSIENKDMKNDFLEFMTLYSREMINNLIKNKGKEPKKIKLFSNIYNK